MGEIVGSRPRVQGVQTLRIVSGPRSLVAIRFFILNSPTFARQSDRSAEGRSPEGLRDLEHFVRRARPVQSIDRPPGYSSTLVFERYRYTQ